MNKKYSLIVGSFIASALLVALPVFAQNYGSGYGSVTGGLGAGVTATASVTGSAGGVQVSGQAGVNLRAALITRATDRAHEEIARRISALNALSTRVNAM